MAGPPPIQKIMRLSALIGFAAATASLSTVAEAQLLSEQTEGIHRICSYQTAPGALTYTGGARTYRVGIGQNCPGTYPLVPVSQPVPPTAYLRSSNVSAGSRTCVYEQAGLTWSFTISTGLVCPAAAGGLAAVRGTK